MKWRLKEQLASGKASNSQCMHAELLRDKLYQQKRGKVSGVDESEAADIFNKISSLGHRIDCPW